MALPSHLEQRLRRIPRSDLTWAVAWAVVLVGVEVNGHIGGPGSDVGGVMVLYALGAATLLRHAIRRFAPLSAATTRVIDLVRSLAPWRVHLGLDLRGTPPLPRGMPFLPAALALVSVVLLGLVTSFRGGFPELLRAPSRISHAVDAVLLAGLWGGLAFATLALFFLQIAMANTFRSTRATDSGRVERLALWSATGLLFVTVGSALTPVVVPGAIVVGVVTVLLVLAVVPGLPALSILFREERPAPRTAVLPGATLTVLLHLGLASFALVWVVVSVGDGHTTEGSDTVTSFLGEVFAWTLAGVYLLQLAEGVKLFWIGLRRNPSRPIPTRVCWVDPVDPARLARARAALEEAGFLAAPPGSRARPTDVPLRLGARSSGWDWPRLVTVEDLARPDVRFAVQRRGEILRRRRLYRGMEKLFREGSRIRFDRGTGFWIGPHLWFLSHMTRDEDEGLGWVGPPYREVFPLEARAHLHEVLTALELDLFFVEDGVGHRRFRRVLSALFEFYDVFGGSRPFDERHTVGLPGVRTIVHDFQLGGASWTSPYPEPNYDDLGRARILHVFRDRGEAFEVAEPPRTWDLAPAPRRPSTLLPS